MSSNQAGVGPIEDRLRVARTAAEAVGAALMQLRGHVPFKGESSGDQLKTPVDKAAEAWILAYILSFYPTDCILAEESFEGKNSHWDVPPAFWTVDALDGTRSFVGGFDGFCVQIGYISDGVPVLGIVHEPVRRITYWGIRGQGAYRQPLDGGAQRLCLPLYSAWPLSSVFVDSTAPSGIVGELLALHNGRHLECGSIGLKICRVAEGEAHVFAKALTFKLWDVAPGQVVLAEAGGKLALWDGSDILYGSGRIYWENLVVAPGGLLSLTVQDLSALSIREAKRL